jgi:hypothetical protein
MPRGRRTSYTRDNNGRFAISPGGGAPKRSTPASRRAATRAGNRLNRDNSGRISGIGRNGATVRGGRLKALGITTRERHPAWPELPTIAEQGATGYATQTWSGLVAPAGTPPAIIQRLNAEGRRFAQRRIGRDDGLADHFLHEALVLVNPFVEPAVHQLHQRESARGAHPS